MSLALRMLGRVDICGSRLPLVALGLAGGPTEAGGDVVAAARDAVGGVDGAGDGAVAGDVGVRMGGMFVEEGTGAPA